LWTVRVYPIGAGREIDHHYIPEKFEADIIEVEETQK
jgi:hypothetical protein